MFGVSRLSDHGHQWMPTALSWDTRVLRGFEYESGATDSIAAGRKAGTKRSQRGRKECECFRFSVSLVKMTLFIVCSAWLTFFFAMIGESSHAWDQRTLLVRRTMRYHSKDSSLNISLLEKQGLCEVDWKAYELFPDLSDYKEAKNWVRLPDHWGGNRAL